MTRGGTLGRNESGRRAARRHRRGVRPAGRAASRSRSASARRCSAATAPTGSAIAARPPARARRPPRVRGTTASIRHVSGGDLGVQVCADDPHGRVPRAAQPHAHRPRHRRAALGADSASAARRARARARTRPATSWASRTAPTTSRGDDAAADGRARVGRRGDEPAWMRGGTYLVAAAHPHAASRPGTARRSTTRRRRSGGTRRPARRSAAAQEYDTVDLDAQATADGSP